MNDERPPSLWWGMWKRFLLAGVAIVALSGAATATVALNKITTLADEIFPKLSHIQAPKGLLTPEYGGGPQTFLILGSDRRSGSKNVEERDSSPHSDTILLVRFDPEQGQTSVLSIPRDLMVNITTPSGQMYANEKINAAYTIGSEAGGANEASVLAAETIKREVFPELSLNGIIDVNFKGFIEVVDTLGCAYVNVDHHYHGGGTPEENYTYINIEPGYQKLCYENALDYVRYRHDDSDFVRVARQQDFLRDLREQINPSNELGQIDRVAKAVGRAIRTNFPPSPQELVLLTKLIAFSQSKPLRQVRFLTSNVDYQLNGGDYVTSTPELEKQTLNTFLNGSEQLQLPKPPQAPHPTHASGHHRHHVVHHAASGFSFAALNLYPTSSTGEDELVQAAPEIPFAVLYPRLQTGNSEQQEVRAYPLRNQQNVKHHAYVVVFKQNEVDDGYYDFEGTDWLNPPLFAHARTQVIDGVEYRFVDDGSHIHVIGWRAGGGLYWVTNTLLEELSNQQMLQIAKSARALR
jgi:polyisoprenyl-teichoic acid--peptidoglycan teichoic acid transferase